MQKKITIILALLMCLPVFAFAETIILKSGKTVEGKLIEKTDKYIKIDFQDVPLTYFLDEINSIDGVKQLPPPEPVISSSNQEQASFIDKPNILRLSDLSFTIPKGWTEVTQDLNLPPDYEGLGFTNSDKTAVIIIGFKKGVDKVGLGLALSFLKVTGKYSEKKKTKILNGDCYVSELNEINKNNVALKVNTYIFLKNNTAWIISYTAPTVYFDKILEEFNEFLSLIKEFPLPYSEEEYLRRGATHMKNGDLTSAILDAENAISINPNSADGYVLLAIIYSNLKDQPKVISNYNKAIAIDSKRADSYTGRGLAYKLTGDLAKAISDFDKAIIIDPKNPRGYFGRGMCYYEIKEYDKAWLDVHAAERLGYVVHPEFLSNLKKASGREE